MAAYMIADIHVNDLEAYKAYISQVPAIVAKHGGDYIVRGGEPENVEGDWSPQRIVVLKFKDRPTALAFLNDPEYQPIRNIRLSNAECHSIVVDG